MKSYDYNAVTTCEGEVYCVDCLPDTYNIDDVSPIFADSEWDYYPTCDNCHEKHEYMGLTSDGVLHEGGE